MARLAQALRLTGSVVKVVAPGDDSCPVREILDEIPVDRFRYFIRGWQQVAYGFGGVPVNIKRRPLVSLQLPFFYLFFLLKARATAHD
ncbi:MAG: glycosyltransferase, partial [Candidatus Binatia bacterium]